MKMQILAKNLMANLKTDLGIQAEKWLKQNYGIAVVYAQKNMDSNVGMDLLMLERGLITSQEAALRIAEEFTCGFHDDIPHFRLARLEFEAVQSEAFAKWIANSAEEIALLADFCPEVADAVDAFEPQMQKISPIDVGISIFNGLGRFAQGIQVTQTQNNLN